MTTSESVDEGDLSTPADSDSKQQTPHGRYLAVLSLAALGVVYGDIGTSPLYALRECFHGAHGIAPTPANIMGVLSLIFWALVIVVSIKYLVFVLRADNHGEGGILHLRPSPHQLNHLEGAKSEFSSLSVFSAPRCFTATAF